jgi:TolB-like protein/Tfp pilus assembly protein PilF
MLDAFQLRKEVPAASEPKPDELTRRRSLRRWLIVAGLASALGIAVLAYVPLSALWNTVVAVASVGAVLSGLVGYWNAYRTVRGPRPAAMDGAAAAVPNGTRPLSIAVLPFINHTGDPAQAYFSDGLSVSVTADLSRIRDAFVVSATTAFSYRDKGLSLPELARALGVHFVLQGSVQRSGARLRINAQLADALADQQLWSEVFEGEATDLFALQDRVTRRIGRSIGREMVIRAARECEARKSTPQVADLLLRAKAAKLQPASIKHLQMRETLYEQVLALEPGNEIGRSGLASTNMLLASNFPTAMDAQEVERRYTHSFELAQQVLEQDPENPDAHAVLGSYWCHVGRLDDAERAYNRRMALAPMETASYNNIGLMHLRKGEPSKAAEVLLKGFELEPNHPSANILFNLGWAYFMLGDIDQSLVWFTRALDEGPRYPNTHAYLAMCHALKGDMERAREAVAQTLAIDPKFGLSALAKIHPTTPKAFRAWRETQFMPAWRQAGLPEGG